MRVTGRCTGRWNAQDLIGAVGAPTYRATHTHMHVGTHAAVCLNVVSGLYPCQRHDSDVILQLCKMIPLAEKEYLHVALQLSKNFLNNLK